MQNLPLRELNNNLIAANFMKTIYLSDVPTALYSGIHFYGILMGIERKNWRRIATYGREFFIISSET